MGWVYLLIAAVFEIAWAISMKYGNGFSRFWPSVVTLSTMAVSVYCLSLAVKRMEVGTAYAVWTGIGAAGTAVLGIILFHESAAVVRLVSICLIIAGIVGLTVTGGGK